MLDCHRQSFILNSLRSAAPQAIRACVPGDNRYTIGLTRSVTARIGRANLTIFAFVMWLPLTVSAAGGGTQGEDAFCQANKCLPLCRFLWTLPCAVTRKCHFPPRLVRRINDILSYRPPWKHQKDRCPFGQRPFDRISSGRLPRSPRAGGFRELRRAGNPGRPSGRNRQGSACRSARSPSDQPDGQPCP